MRADSLVPLRRGHPDRSRAATSAPSWAEWSRTPWHERAAVFLRAAELLGVAPARCIAVEDTPPGIASAKAAGMYAVQVRSASTAFPPIEDADLVLDSLEQFPLAMVEPG